MIRRQIPSLPVARGPLIEEVLGELRQQGWVERELFPVHMALEEALANAIHHGNRCDPTKQVYCGWKTDRDWVEIQIADEGEGFQPDAVPDCTDEDRCDLPGGRGVHLIRHLMSRVQYNAAGNEVTMLKRRGEPCRTPAGG